jgi:gluconolactonase
MDFSTAGPEGWPLATIFRASPPAAPAPFLVNLGVNGLAVDPDGLLVACTHDTRSVSRIDPATAARTLVADAWQSKQFNSPNDAVVRGDGTIYFTDPTWQLGNRPQQIAFKGVYRIAPGGEVALVTDEMGSPNGIALSPDEGVLYVSDDAQGNVRRFAVSPDGSTDEGSVHVSANGADGIAVDCAGNLYATSHQGVLVFDPAGQPLGTIAVGEKPNNCAFGGADGRTLWIAGRQTLYAIDLDVPGPP